MAIPFRRGDEAHGANDLRLGDGWVNVMAHVAKSTFLAKGKDDILEASVIGASPQQLVETVGRMAGERETVDVVDGLVEER
jgi:hypothetical protein